MADISLSEYAERHGINEQRARALAAQGRINARKIGSRWIVADTSSKRIARSAGRSPNSTTVWASARALESHIIDVEPSSSAPARRRAVKQFLARLAEQKDDELLRAIATLAANRGELHYVRAADTAGLASDERVARSGLAWSDSPVQAVEGIDVYVHKSQWRDLQADHALIEVPQSRANARVRVVAGDVQFGRDAPALIAVADLLDVSSPRARVAASSIAALRLGNVVIG